ncbi:MAG TPA: GDSL-type esterase/lipase family protein [Lunatimonas sp.]|nr:GDSL-type esterase/lipase family protein [Lunatimonas sp.]
MKKWMFALLLVLGFESLAQNQDGIRVACVGNSITEGPGRNNRNSYPLMMQKLLGDSYWVKNFGVSGSTLLKKGDLPYWDQVQYNEALEFQPVILIVKLGTNDSKPQNWKFKDDFVENYTELIESIKEVMPENGKVYICLPVPVFEDNWGITERILVKEMRPMLRKVARATGAKVIDLHKPFSTKAGLFPDGVHPNAEGNAQMAELIANIIRE